MTPLGARLGRGGDEKLQIGVGTDDGADVPAVEHGARLAAGGMRREVPLKGEQGGAHLGVGGDDGCRAGDGFASQI